MWNAALSVDSSLETLSQFVQPQRNLTYLSLVDRVKMLQSRAQDLTRLEHSVCNQTYNSTFLSDWGNVLIVSNATTSSRVTSINLHLAGSPSALAVCPADSSCWLNSSSLDSRYCPMEYVHVNEGPILLQNATGAYCLATCPEGHACLNQGSILQVREVIDYCLAETIEPHCKVYINPSLLLAVLICNLLKTICLSQP